ncbi:MAG: fibronectin type III domain-containing protein [Clostridia bacterium]|nr:fibronectin type III domain-containing protein [Clostridia bacterium]
MNKTKKIFSLLISAVIIMSLASCTYTLNAEIKEDGSVDAYNKYTIAESELDKFYIAYEDSSLSGLIPNNSAFPQNKEEFISQSDAKGLTVTTDGVKYYSYQEKNDSITNLNSLSENVLMQGVGEFTTTDFWLYSVSGDNSLYTSVASMLSLVKATGVDAKVEYVIKMPYKIVKTNATKVDDYTVSFSYDDKKVYATTEKSTADWTKSDNIEMQVINFAKAKLKPVKISSLAVAYKNNKSIAIEWDFEDYFSKYTIQRKVGSGKWTTVKNTSSFSYTDKNVKAGKKYSYRVRAYIKTSDFTLTGAFSKTKSLKFANLTAKPSISVKKGVKKATVTIKKFDKTVKGYQIQYSTSSKFKKPSKVYTTKSKKVIKKLKSGKKYYFRVRKYCKDIDGDEVYGAFSKTKSVKIK